MIIDVQTKIGEYIDLYAAIRKHTTDAGMAIAILQEIRKDLRVFEMQQGRSFSTGDFPATENQLAYLKVLGVEAANGITRQEASKLIDDAKTKSVETQKPLKAPIRLP